MPTLYDRLSGVYDWLTASERPYREQALQMLAVHPGETILEIGSGTGQALVPIARATVPGGQAIGLDRSRGMLRQARGKLSRQRADDGRFSLLRADALNIPLRAESCDGVFMSFTLELFELEEQHQLLTAVRCLLKKNGRLALVTLSTYRHTPWQDLYWSLHEHFPRAVDCRPIAASFLLAAAGFSVVRRRQEAMFGLPLEILLAVPAR
jgi:ubiquinone/menaquinone biosynthesis C-methylase UbiE